MEATRKNRSKKGRNKTTNKVILYTSYNNGGPLCQEKETVQTENQASEKNTAEYEQLVKPAACSEEREKPQSVEEELKKKPQPVNPWKLVTSYNLHYFFFLYLISTYFIMYIYNSWDIMMYIQ